MEPPPKRLKTSDPSLPPTSEPSLQSRVTAALAGDGGGGRARLNALARECAAAQQTGALVRLWDALGGAPHAEEATWAAVERLHSRGKGKVPEGSLRLPPPRARALAPARRLHKIVKGRVAARRSDAARAHLDAAGAWLRRERAAGSAPVAESAQQRRALAAALKSDLRLDAETARGLVTKLKQKKWV